MLLVGDGKRKRKKIELEGEAITENSNNNRYFNIIIDYNVTNSSSFYNKNNMLHVVMKIKK